MNITFDLSRRSAIEARHRQSKTTLFWARLGLLALTAFGGVSLPALLDPPVAQAYTSRVNLFVVREQNESFETLVQRSEIIARAAIQRSFDADLLMTDVVVTIIGDNRGVSVPILTVPVSRSEWQLSPDVTQWAQYFEASRNLVVDEDDGEADN
ncbi:MAG: hypothetical protein AAFW95_10435 [Cyanobacteria bacterium J06638_6]